VLDVWKAGAPWVDFIAPDIYLREHAKVMAVLEHYDRPDNALFVAEIGSDLPFARYFFAAIGRGGIGFAPFGTDYTGYSNSPLGAKWVTAETLEPFAGAFRAFAPMAGEWARLALAGETRGAARPDDGSEQVLELGRWRARIQYGQWQFGMPEWFPQADPPAAAAQPVGGVALARLGPDELLVVGRHARVSFELREPVPERQATFQRVEEGHYEAGSWVFERVWNGDQTDYGLNFTERPVVLRVRLGVY
jgi:hypothetical protein